MKVALVHDWLIHMRGGEKVLDALAEIYPDATIYTLFYDRARLSPALKRMKIKASFLQRWPAIKQYYRWLLPILPLAVKSLKIADADLVISSSHCVAKAVPIPPNAYHLCYCHTPMRYVWGFEDDYFKKIPFLLKPLLDLMLERIRKWDYETNKHVNEFIANSENVRQRISRFYKREARVIYPPLDTSQFYPEGSTRDYYLVVSAFVPYKRVDLAIEAFNQLDRSLIVVGSGPLKEDYQKMRRSQKISFLGPVPGTALRKLYSEARALIFPTEEDFGIVPLEAQACGTPVIAFAKGGALESVQAGVFFDAQTPEALRSAVLKFERQGMDRSKIPQTVQRFDKNHFKEQMTDLASRLFHPSFADAAR